MRSRSSHAALVGLVVVLVATCGVSKSFAFAPTFVPGATKRRHDSRHISQSSRCAAVNGDDDFDPLRSPHEYPGGIDAGAQSQQPPSAQPQSDDGFDPFLTSPHDFPSAMSLSSDPESANDVDDDDWSPLRNAMKVERFEDAPSDSRVRLTSGWAVPSAGSAAAPADPPANDNARSAGVGGDDTFDPLLSPHEYPRGIDAGAAQESPQSTSTSTTSTKVGVLLIDHGSRRASSNDRLVELAAAYQLAAPPNYVVAAAHMEIATPTIEDGIRTLLDVEGVGRIVCHPYFLSPGRHVREDIPKLVADAVEAVGRPDVEVATTNHLGSGLDVMVAAIGGLVDETVREMGGGQQGGNQQVGREDEYRLGGFFGEVQRLVDEQLD